MSLKLIYCRLLILQLVACVCFTVDCMCYIVHCPSIRKVCDPASDWSLVMEFHVVLLVACRVACRTVLLHILSAFVGDCASDWSLAIDFNTNVLVACMVTWAESGVCWKSLILGESDTASSSDLSKCLVACSTFNGSQGGRLSCCHRIIKYIYFSTLDFGILMFLMLLMSFF